MSEKMSSEEFKALLKKNTNETEMHVQLCSWIKETYANLEPVFLSDSSGVRVMPWIADQLKKTRSDDAHLDLILLEPRGAYHGMIVELKREGADPFTKKDRRLKKDSHLHAQAKSLDKLKNKGYWTQFAVGIDEAKKVITTYMNLPPNY